MSILLSLAEGSQIKFFITWKYCLTYFLPCPTRLQISKVAFGNIFYFSQPCKQSPSRILISFSFFYLQKNKELMNDIIMNCKFKNGEQTAAKLKAIKYLQFKFSPRRFRNACSNSRTHFTVEEATLPRSSESCASNNRGKALT